MAAKATDETTCVVDAIMDAIALTAFRLQFLTDAELTQLITKLVSERSDKVSTLVTFAENHGGACVADRMKKLIKAHGPFGSGVQHWNRILGNRLVLVEGSNA